MAALSSKPINKVCFILDAGTQGGGGEGHKGPFSPSADSFLPDSTPTMGSGVVKGFIDRGRGCLQKQQSALTVILKLVLSGLTSISFAVLGAVNLQFQGQSVSSSLRPILRIMAAYVGGYSLVIM